MNDGSGKSVPELRATGSPPGAEEAREEIQELVRRTLDGDDGAFSELFERYRQKVYRISFRFTRDYDDAMDLVQTTFIKVHRSLDSYRAEASFATWISRVATNCGIDLVRQRKRQAKVNLDDAMELADEALLDAGQGGPRLSPASEVANAELGEAIRLAVEDLSEKHRSVFVLHCVQGTPYKEIAETLGISIGTVMSRLFHARRYLRKSLAPHLGEARMRELLGESADEESP
jgi:RNA polymerase sigma-70 factor (ECF subfamily)